MAKPVSQELAAALIPTQVKLCPYEEGESAIWVRLIEAQFTAAEVRSQKIKYANLPKQVLWDIWIKSMRATSLTPLLMISRLFCKGNLEEKVAILF
jgi:hypothetical protein